MRRVRYEAEGGTPFLGLSGPLLMPFVFAIEVLTDLVMPAELRFLFPDLEEGLYAQGAPFARHLPHSGLVLLHLTFAIKQLSQDSLSLTGLTGFVVFVVAVVVLVVVAGAASD